MDATAPSFDFPGSEKDMGNGWAVWCGGVWAEEFFKGPAFRKSAGIPNGEAVGINAEFAPGRGRRNRGGRERSEWLRDDCRSGHFRGENSEAGEFG